MSLVGGFCSISCRCVMCLALLPCAPWPMPASPHHMLIRLRRRSLLMPSLFFAVLYWRELRLASRAGCIALLTIGVCLGVGIVGKDLDVLSHQLRTSGVFPLLFW